MQISSDETHIWAYLEGVIEKIRRVVVELESYDHSESATR